MERQKFGKVSSVEFRYKGSEVQHPQTLKLVYERKGKDKAILRMHYQDPFILAFKTYYFTSIMLPMSMGKTREVFGYNISGLLGHRESKYRVG